VLEVDVSNGLTPDEAQRIIDELEAALRQLWDRLTPDQKRQLEEHFLRVWQAIAAIRAAIAAGGAGLAEAISGLGAAMRGLIWRLHRIGAALEELFAALVNIAGRFGAALAPEAGGAAATGGGISAAAFAAVFFLILSLIFLGWRIGVALVDKYGMTPPPAPSGEPCVGDPGAATEEFEVTGRSFWGSEPAFQNAMRKARLKCATRADRCHGPCAQAGDKCLPNVSVQTADYHSRLAYSSVDLTFRCPCECLDEARWRRQIDEDLG
jgi:hypothetical protein